MQDRQGTDVHLKLVAAGKKVEVTKGARLTAKFRELAIKESGLGECSQLCDVGQMEHVCLLITEAFIAARLGIKPGLSQALKSLLIDPLQRFLPTLTVPHRKGRSYGVRMELQPTLELIFAAEEVIHRLDAGPWDEARAIEVGVRLRYAWAIWIAYLASYWMTFEVPKRLAEQRVRRAHGAIGGKVVKQGLERSTGTADQIVASYEDMQKRMESHQVAGAVANKLDMTPQWVRRVWNKHVATKAKQQASL